MLMILISANTLLAQELNLEFDMQTTMLMPGSPFAIDLVIDNPGPEKSSAVLFVALNVGTGDYWFYPSWTQFPPDVDFEMIDIGANSTGSVTIFSAFSWPSGAGTFSGAMFLGAVVHNDVLVSNIARMDFGWTDFPETSTSITCNTDWIERTIEDATQPVGVSFPANAGGTYHIWWDDLTSGSGNSTADITVSAFQSNKTTAYFREADAGYTAPKSIVVAPGETAVYLVIKAESGKAGSFRYGVTFFPYRPDQSVNARQAAAWMTGDFDSYEQSQQQPAYYNITLRMKRIWPDMADGYWMYVEQAMAASPPYRQRVYRVVMAGETMVGSEVYEFLNASDEADAVGAWADPDPLADLSPVDFVMREGCTVFLTREDVDNFMGGTEGKDCESDLNGASYATSEVTLTIDQMRSWDRGYNAEDQQVWGATAGPYIFDKHQNFDAEMDL